MMDSTSHSEATSPTPTHGFDHSPRTSGAYNWEKADNSPELRNWQDDIVTFDTPDDPSNPKNWALGTRYWLTTLYGILTMCATFASSVYSSAVPYVAKEFHVSPEIALLGISLFVAGFILGPPFWTAISELYGRKVAILVPLFIFICFSTGSATAKDYQTLMLTRFWAGVTASSPVSVVGGGLADMFEQRERGSAVVFYSLAVVAGPTFGPIVGGAVSQSHLGWRWTEYLVVILTSTVLVSAIFLLPETFAPVILTRKARALRFKTGRWALHSQFETRPVHLKSFLEKNVTRPLQMIVFEPMVFCITLYNGFTYGILYLMFAAVPIIYEEERGWNPLVGALPFLGVILGGILFYVEFKFCTVLITISQAVFRPQLSILLTVFVFGPHLDRKGGKAIPEKRLPPMMIGAVTFPIGFFLLGWTSKRSIHWFPSVLGLYFIGMSFLLIFQSGINYLIDAYTSESASAVAANTLLRSVFGAALPLAARPLFHNLGVNWACTLLGFISIVLAGIPFLFHVYGPRLRRMSKLAQT